METKRNTHTKKKKKKEKKKKKKKKKKNKKNMKNMKNMKKKQRLKRYFNSKKNISLWQSQGIAIPLCPLSKFRSWEGQIPVVRFGKL